MAKLKTETLIDFANHNFKGN
ncbi:hypothetical protein CCACVL1_07350 [Corchorus capsularis]|uniref:Uncharacterized protein n=1 Tax=Corchorus capsularis TaxID=210143 RepID=A0A1R3J6P6_COCAP|nr:hypothetical protein CCACVL1_07350 [Corchorus capsularis]